MLYYSWTPFHWCINYYCRTDIDEARVISALRHKSKYKSKFNFDLFKKKIKFWRFHAVVLVKTFLLNYYCRTDIDEVRVISFLGVRTDGQTDRHDFGIPIWRHVGTQKISTQSSKLGVSCDRYRPMHPRRTGDAYMHTNENLAFSRSSSNNISKWVETGDIPLLHIN